MRADSLCSVDTCLRVVCMFVSILVGVCSRVEALLLLPLAHRKLHDTRVAGKRGRIAACSIAIRPSG